MSGVSWDPETGGVVLGTKGDVSTRLRPVFHEELDLLGFNEHWEYPRCEEPLLWASRRHYYYQGRNVATVSGGGFFERPTLKLIEKELELKPIDISATAERNKKALELLRWKAIEFIDRVHFEQDCDITAVAFSGGKDSLVVLDLAQHILDDFCVAFSDTDMEFPDTYKAIEAVKKHYPKINFITAKANRPAIENWKLFGPPSRIQRWCCTVHKNAPAMLALNPRKKLLMFEGSRCEESSSRAKRLPVNKHPKNDKQVNAYPILTWKEIDVWLYILSNNLPYNRAYRYGFARVGCLVCPFNSIWSESLASMVYPEEIQPYLQVILDCAKTKRDPQEAFEYLKTGGWKATTSQVREHRVTASQRSGTLTIKASQQKSDWHEWAKTLKPDVEYQFARKDSGFLIQAYGVKDRTQVRRLKATVYKAAYCVACQACEAACKTGALHYDGTKMVVDDTKCIRCGACLDSINYGCLIAQVKR